MKVDWEAIATAQPEAYQGLCYAGSKWLGPCETQWLIEVREKCICVLWVAVPYYSYKVGREYGLYLDSPAAN